jgi:hypothetical protein
MNLMISNIPLLFKLLIYEDLILIHFNKHMSLELTIDLDFLEKINPPLNFPPNEDELNNQL